MQRVLINQDLEKRFDDSIDSVGVRFYRQKGDRRDARGSVVKSVTKQGDKVKVVFITETFVVPAHICVDTNRILRIAPNGEILYYRNCTFGKQMETLTYHVDDALIPADLATAIKPGMWVDVARGKDGAVPLVVFADKSQKKVVAWRGFSL